MVLSGDQDHPHVLTNRPAPLWRVPPEEFSKVVEVNLVGTYNVLRAFLPSMIERRAGVVVNMSSGWGRTTSPEVAPYCASKFALTGMTECWRAELRKHEIRVMQINPSEVLTGFAAAAGYGQKANEKKLRAEEIAGAILGMLSMDDRAWTTPSDSGTATLEDTGRAIRWWSKPGTSASRRSTDSRPRPTRLRLSGSPAWPTT